MNSQRPKSILPLVRRAVWSGVLTLGLHSTTLAGTTSPLPFSHWHHGSCAHETPGDIIAIQSITGRSGAHLHAEDLPPADSLTDPTIVDVLFLYSPQALEGEGSQEALFQRIRDDVAQTNQRLESSGIHVRINAVSINLVQTPERITLNQTVTDLVAGAQGYATVGALRNDFKADVVCMINEYDMNNNSGFAADITNPPGDAKTAFLAVVRRQMGKGFTILAHELGHIFGCEHVRGQTRRPLSDPYYAVRKPYIFASRFQVGTATYVDIMGREPGFFLPNYSNPKLMLDDLPLGAGEDAPEPSDAARTINETAPYVALYRTALSRIQFSAADYYANEAAGAIMVQLTRTGDLNTSTEVNMLIDASSSATSGADYTRPEVLTFNFETNQATLEVPIPLIRDGIAEGEERIQLKLGSVSGSHGLGTNATCVVHLLDDDTPDSMARVQLPSKPTAVGEWQTTAMVRVRANLAGNTPVEIPFHTQNGSALAGVDYTEVVGTLSTKDGKDAWDIAIPILSNPAAQADRSFTVVIGTQSHTVKIVDGQRFGSLIPEKSNGPSANGRISTAARKDGALLIWGPFDEVGGLRRHGIAKIQADGSVDPKFQPPQIFLGHRDIPGLSSRENPSSHPFVHAAAEQADGGVLISGQFSKVDDTEVTGFARLRADGSLDKEFTSKLTVDGTVWSLVIQPDQKILVGGEFKTFSGEPTTFITRLNSDGSRDDSFSAEISHTESPFSVVGGMVIQPDGKIVISGYFNRVNGQTVWNITRLNTDGSLDESFLLRSGANSGAWVVRLQADGKILLGGAFTTIGGRAIAGLARLNPNGSFDATFKSPSPNNDVNGLHPLPDGRILVSGQFTRIAGAARRHFAMLRNDGTLDPGFDSGDGINGYLGYTGLSAGSDGTIWIGGAFETFNGIETSNLIGLRSPAPQPLFIRYSDPESRLAARVHGTEGAEYIVEASDDLKTWKDLQSLKLEPYKTWAVFKSDTDAGEGRFYRLRVAH